MLEPNLFRVCDQVTSLCPVESTIYGYYPSLAGNTFLLAWFAVLLVANTFLGFRYKTWTYIIALTLGCICEVVRYAGRLILNNNPYSKAGFNMQIVTLIIGPAFFTAGIYLTLKHPTLCFGPEYSVIKPRFYTWGFITCDIIWLILQGAGGGLSATADTYKKQKAGNDVALAGIIFQVFTLLVFAALAGVFYYRRELGTERETNEARLIKRKTSFKLFILALTIDYLGILTSCAYRIAGMAPGWRNNIMVSEVDFMVLDGAMIGLSTLLPTVLHPGFCFPRLGRTLAHHSDTEEKEGTTEA